MKNSDLKNIMVFGTFDIFHPGHKNFLKQARKFGNYLIVVVARDETVKKVKGNLPRNNELKRLEVIKKDGLANLVILGNLKDKYRVIEEYKPDIICLGYDQVADMNELRNRLDGLNLKKTEIKRLKSYHPEIYKSSKLKNKEII